MNDKKEPLLMDHDADGITELDNNLPRWWVWLFILTCVWSVGYLIYFHVMDGPDQETLYEREMAAAGAALPEQAEDTASGIVMNEPSTDDAVLAKGQQVFMANCLACHAADGGGLIGPNMTDDYYIHGPTFADSVRIINEGVPAKGMISWKPVLPAEDIYAVASYIYTLRGTTPAAPKAPEGEKATL